MGKLILFMGDSITDSWRNHKGEDFYLGSGYATMVSGALGTAYPYQYDFLNRGVSGNRIVDVYARLRLDAINHKPDYMSILIGINGVWHECIRKNGVDVEKYELIYDLMIQELKRELPNLKLLILEPFVLHGYNTCDTEEIPDRWAYFQKEVRLRAAAAKRIAEKHNCVFVPLQERFDTISKDAPEGYWLLDGVHPTAAGHAIIKDAWLEAFEKIK